MDEKTRKDIVAIFQNNIGNKLTVELCNGMIQAVLQTVEQVKKNEE